MYRNRTHNTHLFDSYTGVHMPVREYGSEQFTYDKASKTLVAEMSELRFQTVPNKLAIKSKATGKVVQFGIKEIERDADGDITVLRYSSLDPAVATCVAILND